MNSHIKLKIQLNNKKLTPLHRMNWGLSSGHTKVENN